MSTDLTSSTQENSSATSQSAERLHRLINELSVEFISILDLDALIDRVAQRLRQVIDYKFFNLFLANYYSPISRFRISSSSDKKKPRQNHC